jgi:uncharacterized protein GlcG (DUF336 family)
VKLTEALEILGRAEAEAERQGVSMSLAVVDAAGHLVALHRMEGASFISPQIAQSKAWTAAAVRRPTFEMGQVLEGMAAGATAFAAAAAEFTGGRFLAAAGGYPIVRKGAVGTSGGTHEQDIAVARAALGDT